MDFERILSIAGSNASLTSSTSSGWPSEIAALIVRIKLGYWKEVTASLFCFSLWRTQPTAEP